MKFYNDNKEYISYWDKIRENKLTAIYFSSTIVWFFKNGNFHNTKNAAFVRDDGYKSFHLNSTFYGNDYKFNKKSWRRFVKMNVFL